MNRAARLLQEREPYYRRAELDVDTDGLSPEAVAREILHGLGLAAGGQ